MVDELSALDLVFAVCGLDAVQRPEHRALLGSDLGERRPAVDHPQQVADARQVGLRELQAVRARIHDDMTVAFVGSSGAGKSTLVNALLGEAWMPTGKVRARDGRGCHVTPHRQLVLLPGGGLLLDTPGMRELQLVDEEGLATVFGDIAALSGRCRFRDCRHGDGPGCAVHAEVASVSSRPTASSTT